MLQSGLQQKARSEGGRPPTHYAPPQVGSAQEEEAERGLAHILEHLAFNATEASLCFGGEGGRA